MIFLFLKRYLNGFLAPLITRNSREEGGEAGTDHWCPWCQALHFRTVCY